jgi:hypothetical protein
MKKLCNLNVVDNVNGTSEAKRVTSIRFSPLVEELLKLEIAERRSRGNRVDRTDLVHECILEHLDSSPCKKAALLAAAQRDPQLKAALKFSGGLVESEDFGERSAVILKKLSGSKGK